jgi:hypothetical protein
MYLLLGSQEAGKPGSRDAGKLEGMDAEKRQIS